MENKKPTPEPVGALGSYLTRFCMTRTTVPTERVGDADQQTLADMLPQHPTIQ